MTESKAQVQIKSIPDKIWMQISKDDKEAIKMAYMALEKQMPKKPIKVDSGVHDYDYDYECPMCRENIDEDEHHCKCGQAIDWSDEE